MEKTFETKHLRRKHLNNNLNLLFHFLLIILVDIV